MAQRPGTPADPGTPGAAAGPGEPLVAVGRVGKARGVRGDVFVEPWTDAPEERFAPGTQLLTDPAPAGPLTVERASRASGKLVVHLVGADTREAADALRGVRLFVPESSRAPLTDPDEFYDSDLVGLRAHAPDGSEVGRVLDVVHTPGGVQLVLDVDGTERFVPFVAAIVPVVDLAAGTLVVDAPDGLFDL